jgi:PAS domain S-box-containing protein
MQFIDRIQLENLVPKTVFKDHIYSAFIKQNAQAIAIFNEQLKFVTANAAFCNVLGIPKEEQLNSFHLSILPFSKDPNFNSLLESLVTNKISKVELETSFKFLNRETKFLKLRMSKFTADGEFSGGILFLDDITQEKEKLRVLEQTIRDLRQKNSSHQKYIDSNLQIENFAYLASHDMKEPLRMIGNFSQLLERRYRDQLDESGKEYLDFIVGGVKNMNLFIDDLLAYSKIESEPHSVAQFNPSNTVFMISRELSKELSTNNIEFILGEMPEIILGSKTKTKKLFTHLISNAIKFSVPERNPYIKVTGIEQDDYWQFEIEDNGIGIKEEFYEKIFLLFKRLHPRNEYPGSGIGLALCKKIVEQHGGRLWIESNFGKGSKFIFNISKKVA